MRYTFSYIMKTRITVSIDEDTDDKLREQMRKEFSFRNKSHLVGVALKEFLERRTALLNK